MADFSTEFQRGWLTSESIVQLKLFGDNSLNIWKSKFEGQQLCVKVSSSEDSQNWSVFEVANLNNEGGKLQPQMEGGIVYHETDFILFQAQVLEISSVAFKVEISLSTDDFPGKLIGFLLSDCRCLTTKLQIYDGLLIYRILFLLPCIK